ncbi:hypothetical protein GH741_18920 [Aquibacillus halophilus]|uniref:Uncharacterized protein n=1 Tax=Aquibacillus halophilus TaxID=930132 RepID=A0A6A8DGE6_9BACI|nr:hypothetical protein [Aquibacillus halophilus]MRH44724.1 hypothetical protein [Aquibacillus halophilus]
MNIKQRFYWLIPAIGILIAIGLLFYQNLSNVAEAPEENWSKALPIGETSINKYPYVTKTDELTTEIVEFDSETLVKRTYGDKYTIIDEEEFPDIPFNKWTKVFAYNNELFYFQYKTIYDGVTGKKITEADSFHPLKDYLVYVKGNTVFELDPQTKKSNSIYNFDTTIDELVASQTEGGIVFLTYTKKQEDLNVSVYEYSNDSTTNIHQQSFSVSHNERIQDASVAYEGNRLAFLFRTERKGAGGTAPVNTLYLFDNNRPTLNQITFNDPKGSARLNNVSDISLAFHNQKIKILFSANGKSKTKYNAMTAFNIYEAIEQDGSFEVFRRSNTSSFSAKPQWINNNTVTWIDLKGASNKILLSSSDEELIEQTRTPSNTDLVVALGKTIGMLSVAFLAILLSSIWFIWPLILLIIIYLSRRNLLDRDPNWVYYVGLVSYALAVILFKHRFFIDTIYMKAPEYLTFQYSDWLSITVFGIIAHFCATYGAIHNEWNVPVKLVYFMGVHIVLLAFFFGPYFL